MSSIETTGVSPWPSPLRWTAAEIPLRARSRSSEEGGATVGSAGTTSAATATGAATGAGAACSRAITATAGGGAAALPPAPFGDSSNCAMTTGVAVGSAGAGVVATSVGAAVAAAIATGVTGAAGATGATGATGGASASLATTGSATTGSGATASGSGGSVAAGTGAGPGAIGAAGAGFAAAAAGADAGASISGLARPGCGRGPPTSSYCESAPFFGLRRKRGIVECCPCCVKTWGALAPTHGAAAHPAAAVRTNGTGRATAWAVALPLAARTYWPEKARCNCSAPVRVTSTATSPSSRPETIWLTVSLRSPSSTDCGTGVPSTIL